MLVAPLFAFVGVLAAMSGVKNAITNVKALIVLAGAMTALLYPLTLIGAIAMLGGGKGAISIGAGILALTAMIVPLFAFIGVLAVMSHIENAMTNAELLATFMTTMGDLLVKISKVAPLAVMGVAAMDSLVLLIAAVGAMATAIGWLVNNNVCPDIQTFLDKGIPVLEQLAEGIGTMIGNFIGGIGAGLSNGLVKIGDNISEFMGKLSEASGKASNIKGESLTTELINININ